MHFKIAIATLLPNAVDWIILLHSGRCGFVLILKHLFLLIGFGAVVYVISLLLMGVRLNDLKSATE